MSEKNVLNRQQFLRLYSWVTAHEADIKSGKVAYHKIAETAAGRLGFPVSASNVRSLLRDAGIKVERPVASNKNETRIRMLAKAICEIAAALGHNISDPRVTELANGYR